MRQEPSLLAKIRTFRRRRQIRPNDPTKCFLAVDQKKVQDDVNGIFESRQLSISQSRQHGFQGISDAHSSQRIDWPIKTPDSNLFVPSPIS